MSFKKTLVVVLSFWLCISAVNAQPVDLQSELKALLKEHSLIVAADQSLISAEQQFNSAKTGWYPTFSFSGEYGYESYDGGFSDETDLPVSIFGVTLSQTLLDFGKTSGQIEKAKKQVLVRREERVVQSQSLLLSGLEAYANLRKAYRVLAYANQSEENVKAQANLENERVKKGRGYTTDVLQAKAELVGARARRAEAEQALSIAQSRYSTVFGSPFPEFVDMPELSVPLGLLPASADELMDVLLLNSPVVRREMLNVDVAGAERELVESVQWMPSLDLVASSTYTENQDGVDDRQINSNQINLEFNWDINLGGRSSYQVRTAVADEAMQRSQADYVVNTEKEAAMNAWTNLRLAKERTKYLQNKVEVLGAYLSLARKERELGRRSLIDVLSGETSLINAQSDYSAAQADLVVASYNILLSIGRLELSELMGLKEKG